MSKHSGFRSALVLLAAVLMAVLAHPLAGAEPSTEAARLETFTHADGSTYFALSLSAGPVELAKASDVVVLFDTSASQTGQYRADALASLKALLAGLKAEDRVQLIAVDVNTVPMTEGFVKPAGNEIAAALQKLEQRVPLGATDMEKALQSAAGAFDAEGTRPKAAVYIGDGISAASFLGTETFESLTASLVEKRIPVSAHGIGPKVNLRLLGALANQTGGRLVADWDKERPEEAGAELAAAAAAPVLWPQQDQVVFPGGFEVYPMQMPPLRADRDTVLIGKYAGGQKGPFDVQATVSTPQGPKEVKWSAAAKPSSEDNAFLVQLVEIAQVDGGRSLPVLGSESLAKIRQEINAGVYTTSQLAAQALSGGNLDEAERLAKAAQQNDPGNPEAQAILRAVAKKRAGGAAQPEALQLVGPGEAPKAAPLAPDSTFMNTVAADNRAFQQMIETETRNVMENARRSLESEPEVAIQNLKQQLETIKRTTGLDPDRVDQLVDQLQAAIQQAQQRQMVLEKRRQEQQERIATAREQVLRLEETSRTEQKIKQLMDRFNSLMDEQKYAEAEQFAAMEAAKLSLTLPSGSPPDGVSPAAISAIYNARQVGHLTKGLELRVERQRKMLDALHQVELAHVPFPDEPPIVYPDAEVWAELTARRKERYRSMDLASRGDAERRIRSALDDPTTLDFIETPLSDVIEYWKDLHKIEIQIDQKALDDVGIGTDTPISRTLDGISLRSALRLVLRDLDLTYVIRDEVLMITTPEEAELELSTKVYPVADLVIPPSMMQMGGGMMGGGMMGGMMGGMGGYGGGMMGGMGGGMMGGMGGMGGMGMGGMGGGFMNVPANPRNKLDPRFKLDPRNQFLPDPPQVPGFQAFAVKDDLSVAPESVKAPENKVEPISLAIPEGADPRAHWSEYFEKNSPAHAAVRQAVRELMKAQKYDQVIAMIQAALRKAEPQPWMYEAMALAMQAAGHPKEEIERVVLSAADFCDNPLDLLFLGVYMDRLGLEQRALKTYQQVAQVAPHQPEPFMYGLRLAQRIDDVEGIKWATIGILGQAWTGDQQEVWLSGLRAAKAMLERLRKEKRAQEADAYETALNEALVRDCFVKVSWTGNADVDLIMAEPSGTICSHRNPRTTGGGVMGSDAYSSLANTGQPVCSEMYVCPKAFSGDYQMLLRRVWGNLTAGKVTVEIHTNYGTKEAKVLTKTVELDGDEAAVVFNVDQGRRKESLQQQQIANAAAAQLALHDQIIAQRPDILAQQLAGVADRGSMADYLQSGAAGRGAPLFALGGGGAVGYQPVIIQLPEGTNLSAFAVISADRRYVRVAPMPLFSGIAEVNVFNTATGSNTSGQGGTGGQGYSGLGGGGMGGFGGGGMGGFGGGMGGGMGGFGGGMGGYGGGMGGGYGGGGYGGGGMY
jgi:tetratricopeptide (TPR) repeat protein